MWIDFKCHNKKLHDKKAVNILRFFFACSTTPSTADISKKKTADILPVQFCCKPKTIDLHNWLRQNKNTTIYACHWVICHPY